jgi:hypothetical protein
MKETNSQCVEIAFFKFDSKQSVEQQQMSIKIMGAWLSTQPGFVSRKCYFDESQSQWVDCVNWGSLSAAEIAMANSIKEPTLDPILSSIDMSSFKVGHYAVFQ